MHTYLMGTGPPPCPQLCGLSQPRHSHLKVGTPPPTLQGCQAQAPRPSTAPQAEATFVQNEDSTAYLVDLGELT